MVNPNSFGGSESGYGYNNNGTERTEDDYLIENGNYPKATEYDDDYIPGENSQAVADDIAFKKRLAKLAELQTANQTGQIAAEQDTKEREETTPIDTQGDTSKIINNTEVTEDNINKKDA